MATTATPATAPPSHTRTGSHSHSHSHSHPRTNLPSRPTTPLRPPSRTSLRASQSTPSGAHASLSASDFPLANLEPAFAELSDSMADLEANFMHLQLLNESLGRFNEDFGAFLYGLNMSAFCVDFPEAPIPQSFARHPNPPTNNPSTSSGNQYGESPFRQHQRSGGYDAAGGDIADATFLTTDTSFVENPPTSTKPASKYAAPPSSARERERQSVAPGGRGGGRGRGGGLTGAGRGTRGGTTGRAGSGIGRGGTRGARGSVR